MSAALRLEDFSAPPPVRPPSFTAGDLAAEYRRGQTDGATAARDTATEELTAALRQAVDMAEGQAEIRRLAIRDTLHAITPVLRAAVAQLSAGMEERLTQIIAAELKRLCLAGIAPTCHIAVSSGLIQRLADRIEALGLDHVTLVPGSQTEITFDGGRITIAPDEITAQIASCISDLSPAEEA